MGRDTRFKFTDAYGSSIVTEPAEERRFWRSHGVSFVVACSASRSSLLCRDADDNDPEEIRREVQETIVEKSGVVIPCVVVVPVQEMEPWWLADLSGLGNLFQWCTNIASEKNPESINSPKEHLVKLTKHPKKKKSHYSPPTHHPRMAEIIDLDAVYKCCPSFQTLVDFVREEFEQTE